MSFSQKVADKALVACGRHCALCHKYCGLKMELHHIKHQSEGGEDTFENCIPLCLDCHADMRSYDHQHPKGRKFSNAELIAHRDNWYAKISAAGGVLASPQHVELDKAVFRRIGRLLPFQGIISQLKNRYIGMPYVGSQFDSLEKFQLEFSDPTFEFLDADLEGALASLRSSLSDYMNYALSHVFMDSAEGELRFHPEMKYTDPERYYEIVYAAAEKEGAFLNSYNELVKLARRKLAINPD